MKCYVNVSGPVGFENDVFDTIFIIVNFLHSVEMKSFGQQLSISMDECSESEKKLSKKEKIL